MRDWRLRRPALEGYDEAPDSLSPRCYSGGHIPGSDDPARRVTARCTRADRVRIRGKENEALASLASTRDDNFLKSRETS
jgi:hypothetical protein